MEKNFAIVKSFISNAQVPHIQSSKSSDTISIKIYASLLHHLHSFNPLPSILPRLTINKDQEIVVCFNISEQKATLPDVFTDVILKDLNIRMESIWYRNLRAVKRLLS